MIDEVVAKMRADWAIVSRNRRESGDWTESEEADILAAIKAAIDAKDKVLLACWSRWLADLSALVTAWNLICRGAEVAMKEAAIKHKGAETKEKGQR